MRTWATILLCVALPALSSAQVCIPPFTNCDPTLPLPPCCGTNTCQTDIALGSHSCQPPPACIPAMFQCDPFGEACCGTNTCQPGPFVGAYYCLPPSAGGDPHLGGFQGQHLFFDGKDGVWYSLLKEKRLAVNTRTAAFRDGRFFSAFGITLPQTGPNSEAGTAANIGIFTRDSDHEDILHGALQVELNGAVLPLGMHEHTDSGLKIAVVEVPQFCKYDIAPAVVEMVAAAKKLAREQRRKLRAVPGSDSVLDLLVNPAVTDAEKCRAWIEWSGSVEDGFSKPLPPNSSDQTRTTVLVQQDDFSFRIEHFGDAGRGPEHYGAGGRLDIFLLKYEPDAEASGVWGQTVKLQLDDLGNPIYFGAGVLPGGEDAYVTSGPFDSLP